ncbi:hypothetical protein HYDPIDRAFT_81491 [Hydnomerulius pinastri MD-312]|nr:hypothetical protein HYDPIDRAFT_81491 [Hydnomerulius pinastri MD-312]
MWLGRSDNNTSNGASPAAPPQQFPQYSWRDRTSNPTLLYITDHRVANAQLDRLPHGPLGFDLEWRPNYRKGERENPVAVVQLASADIVMLLQISAMSEFPNKLRDLLDSTAWTKAGVGIQHDCKKLHNDWRVSVRNCIDLSLLARTVDNVRWKGKYTNPIGLARLLETYEQATLAKGKIQRSNWELPLSPLQREYAANDAHAGYVIHWQLNEMVQAMNPVPLPAYYSFSVINGIPRDHLGVSPWQAHNPFYDPGPPPPPRDPNDPTKKQRQRGASAAVAGASNSVVYPTNQLSFATSTTLTSGVIMPIPSSSHSFQGRQYRPEQRARYHTENGGGPSRARQPNQTPGSQERRRRPRPAQIRYPMNTGADTA